MNYQDGIISILSKKNYKKDEDEFDSYKEKFNFDASSNNGITLKILVSLHNDNFSRENRFLLVEIGKSIEALITVHQMCEFGCHDLLFDDSFPEEHEILEDRELKKKIEEKIWKLWNLAVELLQRESNLSFFLFGIYKVFLKKINKFIKRNKFQY